MTDDQRPGQPGTTHFGFKTVREDEKASLVRGVFDSVAAKYDLMNDLMSGGIHRLWKSAFLDWLRPQGNQTLLDVGGGTGDIAFGWKNRGGGPAMVCDINREMLAVGRDRSYDRNLIGNLGWICGDAETLPVADSSVDRYTIAFCLRNVTHWDRAIAEAYRVLKPGGRFMCLEFSKVQLPGLREAYDVYSFQVLPRIGQMVTGNREAYQYLAESIRRFPPQQEMAEMVRAAGFERVEVRNLSGGIAAIHSGWRL
ncbi:bifunctional demethylmenaquinone methyltransferase/2-methoxy-6-polyprenyl-1,4-benzoquinol methylase UbiE [Magnetospirillum sp. UT-4]|uniref:bifunctional demethylmenaquinone methyltransferase/2-methoxy-6-polyprenyl-1,4-benzoquinol methylase UbiE n=1 Tax=Magnetospirillum sp. UT-4 TaxID=2681467 RepID=UPI0013821B3E|nr:bifunctional demethylmenaquinone methyltransferase/2-methoxy-6-polyprenyl-1,4-benzoquinol methylase UbiE [Magnetospirillum sp. UT-4]CAA7611822.1 bifunctional 2-octaprenyl-6-methoxy-1,4-benzoquinone methylase and S-adenosylmethionine:2-DMK methyltransferase [Magnetospirillum sp. UT-4]